MQNSMTFSSVVGLFINSRSHNLVGWSEETPIGCSITIWRLGGWPKYRVEDVLSKIGGSQDNPSDRSFHYVIIAPLDSLDPWRWPEWNMDYWDPFSADLNWPASVADRRLAGFPRGWCCGNRPIKGNIQLCSVYNDTKTSSTKAQIMDRMYKMQSCQTKMHWRIPVLFLLSAKWIRMRGSLCCVLTYSSMTWIFAFESKNSMWLAMQSQKYSAEAEN